GAGGGRRADAGGVSAILRCTLGVPEWAICPCAARGVLCDFLLRVVGLDLYANRADLGTGLCPTRRVDKEKGRSWDRPSYSWADRLKIRRQLPRRRLRRSCRGGGSWRGSW